MITLAWFTEEACRFGGIDPSTWEKLSQAEKHHIIDTWQKHIGAKQDFTQLANFTTKMRAPRTPAEVRYLIGPGSDDPVASAHLPDWAGRRAEKLMEAKMDKKMDEDENLAAFHDKLVQAALADVDKAPVKMTDIVAGRPVDLPYEDFAKLDIRSGKVLTAERVPKSKKLLKLEVDFGEQVGKRVILAGVGKDMPPEAMLGIHVVAVLNLAPRPMVGVMSYGMILAGHTSEGYLSLVQCPGAANGSEIG